MSNATAPTEPTTSAAPAAKVGVVPILVAVVLSTVVALVAVAGVGFYLVKSGRLSPVAAPGAPGAAEKQKEATSTEQMPGELPPSHVLALEPMVVNLSDPGGRSYLRASISLRIADEVLAKGEKKKEEGKKDDKPDPGTSAALRDTTLAVLGAQTSDALLQNGGLDALKKKMRETYAIQNRETHVLDVYVTDFLVQRG